MYETKRQNDKTQRRDTFPLKHAATLLVHSLHAAAYGIVETEYILLYRSIRSVSSSCTTVNRDTTRQIYQVEVSSHISLREDMKGFLCMSSAGKNKVRWHQWNFSSDTNASKLYRPTNSLINSRKSCTPSSLIPVYRPTLVWNLLALALSIWSAIVVLIIVLFPPHL